MSTTDGDPPLPVATNPATILGAAAEPLAPLAWRPSSRRCESWPLATEHLHTVLALTTPEVGRKSAT